MDILIIFHFIILIFSIVIHEVSHGYMSYYLGDPTAKYEGRLTLNPIKHIDPFGSIILPIISYSLGGIIFGWAKPVPYNPYNLRNQKWGEALVAIAGPISNISIALCVSALIRISFEGTVTPFIEIASLIVLLNLVLTVFNLVPIPPLDGSKILFAFLPYEYANIRTAMEKYSLLIFFFFLFFLWQFLLPIIFFIFSLFTGIAF